jgi:hypothetical protein
VTLPRIPHPLSDSEGEGSVRTETRSPVVWLSEGRLDLIGKVGRAGGRVVVVSDGLSSLTEPMRDALRSTGGAWVVRGGDGVLRDGLSGRRLERFQDALGLPRPTSADELAVGHLRPEPAEALQLAVSYAVRHRAAPETLLGDALERLCLRLSGDVPSGWSTSEPTSRSWDRAELTEFVRGRMPRTSRLVVSGRPGAEVSGTLTAQRTSRGVEETFTGLVSLGPVDSPEARRRLDDAPAALGALASAQTVLVATMLARPGRADLTRPPLLESPATPRAVLVGAPAVRERGLDVEATVAALGAEVVGRARLPALLVRLVDARGTVQPDRLRALVDAVGLADLARDSGLPDDRVEEVRRATEQ